MSMILLLILIILLLGAAPAWPHSRNWGYGPSGGLGLIVVILLVLILLANAFWSVLFFRWRDLRASFAAFIPYAALVAALVVSLVRSYPFGAVLFICYCAYLLYATWWGYRLWLLNT